MMKNINTHRENRNPIPCVIEFPISSLNEYLGKFFVLIAIIIEYTAAKKIYAYGISFYKNTASTSVKEIK